MPCTSATVTNDTYPLFKKINRRTAELVTAVDRLPFRFDPSAAVITTSVTCTRPLSAV